MVYVELTCYKIEKLNMINRILASGAIEGANRDSFSVDYSSDNTVGVAALTEYVELNDNPQKFCIELTLEGGFLFDGIKTKKQKEEAHKKCYDILFPIAQEIIKYLTIHSGMSGGIIIQKRTLKQINFGSKPEEKSDKIIDFPTDW